MELLNSLLFDYTLRTVALGAATLGIVSGALGSFAVLRRQSLLGDAMSHAALPGVVIAFMLTGSKTPVILLVGAAVAGWLGALLMNGVVRNTRIKEDSALGIILSVFFGFGLMLLTFLQRNPDARQAGLNSFLFGQAATLLISDVIPMAILGTIVLLLVLIFWKEFKLLSFDRDFAASLGYPVAWLDVVLTSLLVLAIVVGLQAVGVVLMSAMVVAPAAAARQWTDRLGVMVFLAALFGAIAGVGGAMISSLGSGLSTGPVVVLVVSGIVLLSLLFAPNRGLVWNWVRQQRDRRKLRLQSVLTNMYYLAEQHDDMAHPHAVTVLQAMNFGQGGVRRSLHVLRERGLVQESSSGFWALTAEGVEEARQLIDSRRAGKGGDR
ncbi:MAG: metal ABC transporter permease [Chloroflexi bacterium]|nr:MAG: metal ABC transporter permease [Chloroflexota bacterium]